MSRFECSKAELQVIFDLAGVEVVTGLSGLTPVSEAERRAITARLAEHGLIDGTSQSFRPDRGLVHLLRPVVCAHTALILRIQGAGLPRFDLSLYTSREGIATLTEESGERVSWMRLKDPQELFLLLPSLRQDRLRGIQGELCVSYLLLEPPAAVLHCGRIDLEHWRVRIAEGERVPGAPVKETQWQSDGEAYFRLLRTRLESICCAAGN